VINISDDVESTITLQGIILYYFYYHIYLLKRISLIMASTKYNCNAIFLCFVNTFTIVEDCNEQLVTSHSIDIPKAHLSSDKSTHDKKPHILKRKRKDLLETSNVEEELRIQRLRNIIRHEETLADIKLKHEEKVVLIKEEHLKLFNDMQLNHLKEVQKLEIEIKKSELKGTKLGKENIDP